MPAAWLILPTYNEAENIEALVRAVLPRLEESGADPRILIVDDGSPDGTGEIADGLAAELDCVEVLHRPSKQGLGRAYLAGFAVALERGADLVLEMDSDFSHDPADVPRLIAAAAVADLALGSRYVPGGGITEWGAVRRLLSRGGSAYARLLLGIPVRDLTGGFKCFRREVLEAIDLEAVHADGYGFQIELTYRAVQAGFTVTEVPIVFRERRLGRSKMTAKIAIEAVWKVPALRLRLRRPPAPAPAAERAQEPAHHGGDQH
ncbi:MAG: polyprenol monophosphomannose synthase [Thermoleophilaceae bacterium]